MQDINKPNLKIRRILLLVLVIIIGAIYDFLFLLQTTNPLGLDGYYYALQIKCLLSKGHLYFQTNTPLILYILASITYLIDNSILAVKIGSIIFHTLLSLGIFAIVSTLTKSMWHGIIGVVMATISNLHLFMIVEFISYLGAITFLIWGIWFLIKAFETQKLKWIIPSGFLLTIALFSHRSIYLIFPVMLCLILFTWLVVNFGSKLNSKVLISGVTIILWIIPVFVKNNFLENTATPSIISLNILFQETFDHLPEIIMLFLASTVILCLIRKNQAQKFSKTFQIVITAMVFWTLLISINPFFILDNNWESVIGRIKGLAYIQTAILFPVAAYLFLQNYNKLAIYATSITIPLIIMSGFSPLPYGAQPQYLANRDWLLKKLIANISELRKLPIIIAPHGEEFLATYIIDIPSQQRPPVSNKYENVYWLVHNVEKKHVDGEILRLNSDINDYDTIIIDDKSLSKYLQSVSSFQMSLLKNSNTHLLRKLE